MLLQKQTLMELICLLQRSRITDTLQAVWFIYFAYEMHLWAFEVLSLISWICVVIVLFVYISMFISNTDRWGYCAKIMDVNMMI